MSIVDTMKANHTRANQTNVRWQFTAVWIELGSYDRIEYTSQSKKTPHEPLIGPRYFNWSFFLRCALLARRRDISEKSHISTTYRDMSKIRYAAKKIHEPKRTKSRSTPTIAIYQLE